MTNWKEELNKISQCPQRQDSSYEQLRDLIFVANKLGFYDAASDIKAWTEQMERKESKLC